MKGVKKVTVSLQDLCWKQFVTEINVSDLLLSLSMMKLSLCYFLLKKRNPRIQIVWTVGEIEHVPPTRLQWPTMVSPQLSGTLENHTDHYQIAYSSLTNQTPVRSVNDKQCDLPQSCCFIPQVQSSWQRQLTIKEMLLGREMLARLKGKKSHKRHC